MNRSEKQKNVFARFFKHIYTSYIPNGKDNAKQITIKILFLVSLITLIASAVYLIGYFSEAEHQNDLLDDSREIWHTASDNASDTDAFEVVKQKMLAENDDFKGWITVGGTQIDNPIYQAEDNEYYLNHNQKKQKSAYGALFFDCDDEIDEYGTDKNLVIYGHRMKNGSMFGTLKKLRSLDFYKKNPTVSLSTLYDSAVYKIYAIFVLNASKSDDNGYIYDIYRQDFADGAEFEKWRDEAYERSLINTGVELDINDSRVALVTCSSDFENSRLVVMARRVRAGESETVDTSSARVNPNPLYPQKWYDERGINK